MNRHLTTYFRFDPPQDLSQINPLDVTSMADIEAIVHDYVDGADVRDRLVQCASKLQVPFVYCAIVLCFLNLYYRVTVTATRPMWGLLHVFQGWNQVLATEALRSLS